MKTIYLHIGTPKTGTTYIQSCLHKNKHVLEKIGYLYPKNGLINFAHHNLSFELGKERDANPSFGLFADAITEILDFPYENCIISSEAFSVLKYNELLSLKKKLEGFKVFIIASFRRQDEFLASLWSHSIINKQSKLSLPEFIKDKLNTGTSMDWKKEDFYPYYNYYYDMWGSIFGKESIKILLYDLKNASVLEEFLIACDIKEKTIWEALKLDKLENKSPSFELLELCRFLHNNYSDAVPNIARLVVNKAIKQFASKRQAVVRKKGGMNKNLSGKIMEHFSVSNAALAEKLKKPSNLFKERSNFDSMEKDMDYSDLSFSDYSQMLLLILNKLTHSGVLSDSAQLKDGEQQFLMDSSKTN